ncbi:toll/interleukin-1 receptor domain-containing protein [Streptomyces sp. V4I2]|uniref:toll/interleukin-1 receptor domain-containing protein n=1 Tax=Streptomyces sp. V4I2 TaxID=3042280 RepID=UPI002784F486|nr:toll/interleukin-1 receptor domain-containing protein [Streptomyces sp. V4I2]MDQ1050301.1 MinD-like ATPase involved in chromosome partitioning or flagellar assembly [Streptomyces sp. V4I2]
METGQIVTFYSYKGGVGRSFALANTAVLLARWGYRVLCVDWDLEAPGLSYFFDPYLESSPRTGLLEMVEEARDAPVRPSLAMEHRTAVSLPKGVRLDLIPAGRQDETYISRLQEVDWENLYADHDFGETLESWRAEWMNHYDVVLVDSRTGITDSGGICTAQVPDVLVFAFTANQQNVDGVLDIVDRAMKARDGLPYDRPRLLTVPLLSRFDAQPEYEQGETWRRTLAERMEPRLRDWAPRGSTAAELLQRITIPYFPIWSFGESLPALTESHRNPEQVTYSIASLAALLARRLEDGRLLIENRDSYVDSAVQAARRTYEADVFISYSRTTQKLARDIIPLLNENGVTTMPGRIDGPDVPPSPEMRQLFMDECRHLVMLADEHPPVEQEQDIMYFLRHSVSSVTERLTLPVVTSSEALATLPHVARTLQAFNLENGTLPQAARAIAAQLHNGPGPVEFSAPGHSPVERFDVFVSYAHADQDWALALAENLQRLGLRVWVDQWHLALGDHWASRLQDALANSDVLVPVVSPHWMRSTSATQEYTTALGRKRVVTVLLGDTDRSPFVSTEPQVDFRGVSSPKHYVSEVERLARLVLGVSRGHPLPRRGSFVLPDYLLH